MNVIFATFQIHMGACLAPISHIFWQKGCEIIKKERKKNSLVILLDTVALNQYFSGLITT